MKNFILTFTALIIFLFSYGQKIKRSKNLPPGVPSAAELAKERRNHDCVQRYKRPLSERLKHYPFNLSKTIKLVSYFAQPSSQDSTIFVHNGLPLDFDTVCYSKLNEIITLNSAQIDTLTNILYNTGFRGNTFIVTEIKCYEPRNAILFIDSLVKTFAYIELCFGCDKYEVSSNKIYFGEVCKQKFDLLRHFFLSAGVYYGTSGDSTD